MLTSRTTNIILCSIKLYNILFLLCSICNAHSSYGNGMNLLLKISFGPDSGIVTYLIESLFCFSYKSTWSVNSLEHNTCCLTLHHI